MPSAFRPNHSFITITGDINLYHLSFIMAKVLSFTLIGLYALISSTFSAITVEEYLQIRDQSFQRENDIRLGSSQRLDYPQEIKVNNIIMMYKSREYKEGLDSNGAHFATAGHFFHTKPLIEASNVFKIIRLLPKGASLHMHDDTVPSVEWVARNLTYMDNLYVCVDSNDYLSFHFFEETPSSECAVGKNWTLVADMRASASSVEFIDSWFAQSLSLYTPQPDVDYPNINEAWKKFEAKITTAAGIGHYEPALRRHFYKTLQEHYDDNVMYIEERGLLNTVYLADQTVLKPIEALKVHQEVVQKFKEDHPDFWGAKYIYAPHRFHSSDEVAELINEAVEMKSQFPVFFAGFDLVGQEDLGTPLLGFLPELLAGAAKDLKYFFHAGETAWHGTKVDENLIDAILLNTTRIGHAYALASHPTLAEEVQRRQIFVESCPISNQVLKLVDDFRNHPAVTLMKQDFPLVIASDNPGIWGASALSYDWYVAFMAMSGAHTDLKFLKQLALNSIEASAMRATEKALAYGRWQVLWLEFLEKVIQLYEPEYLNYIKAESN